MPYAELVARAETPRGELVLRRRGGPTDDGPTDDRPTDDGVLELRANGVFVMDTAETSTERALATHALALHPAPRHVVVGGLGLGFTASAVLADERVTHCTVVEIEPALVGWLRAGVVPGSAGLLADPRLDVVVADVADALTNSAPGTDDLVLLDVDNGPGYLVHDANAALYREPFLRTVRRVLRPGGVCVIWSAAEAPTLLDALQATFGEARAVPYDVDLQGRDETYWLYVGRVDPA